MQVNLLGVLGTSSTYSLALGLGGRGCDAGQNTAIHHSGPLEQMARSRVAV